MREGQFYFWLFSFLFLSAILEKSELKTVGHSDCGKQYGGSPKNETQNYHVIQQFHFYTYT